MRSRAGAGALIACLGFVVGVRSVPDTDVAADGELVPDNVADAAAPGQPISFSHSLHAGTLGIDCAMCHVGPDPGREMTFPAESTCMSCHTEIASGSDEVQQLKRHFDSSQPVPWKRVYEIVPGIEWSHKVHLGAGLRCETCHGNVRQLEVMKQVKAVTAMASCIHCHEAKGVPASCETCHAWPTDDYLLSGE